MMAKKGKTRIEINSDDREQVEEVVEEAAEVSSAYAKAIDRAEKAENAQLKEEIEKLREKVDSLEEEVAKEQAKFQNMRRRADEERREAVRYGAQDIALDLLNVLDYFEMGLNFGEDVDKEALKPYIQGVEYTIDEFKGILKKHGIEEIPTDILFDPNIHQAFERVEDSDEPSGTILQVKRKGYMLLDRVLRNALVSVAATQAGEEDSVENNEEVEIDS